MKLKMILTTLLVSTQVFGAVTESARCQKRKDSLGSDVAKGRSSWALKCFPDLNYQADPDGQFYLFDAQAQKQHIGYPSFGKIDAAGKLTHWVAPTDPKAGCVDPQVYKLVGFCRAGCYTPDQMILFSDGYQSIGEAKNQLRPDIVSLSTESTIDNLILETSELKSYTSDLVKQNQEIAVIRTSEGGVLKVTMNHPLVVSSGIIKEARHLKVGDQLISEEGTFEAISSIEVLNYYGKVMNVEMNDREVANNIVVAQGYLNGSVMFQNIALSQVNREVLRTLIPDSAL